MYFYRSTVQWVTNAVKELQIMIKQKLRSVNG